MTAVIDASIVVAAFSPDELEQTALVKLSGYFGGGGRAPALWALEVANVLLTKRRRGILTAGECEDVWRTVSRIPVEIRHFEFDRISRDVRPLAARHDLSSYDACYLQLALDDGVALATVDRRLIAAARSEGIQVL